MSNDDGTKCWEWTLHCKDCDEKKVVRISSKTIRRSHAPEWFDKHALHRTSTTPKRVTGPDDAFY